LIADDNMAYDHAGCGVRKLPAIASKHQVGSGGSDWRPGQVRRSSWACPDDQASAQRQQREAHAIHSGRFILLITVLVLIASQGSGPPGGWPADELPLAEVFLGYQRAVILRRLARDN
jgi:hypothetical protein